MKIQWLLISSLIIGTVAGLVRAQEREPMVLAVRQAIEIALTHNPDLSVERLEPEKARESVAAAQSIFDPAMSLGFTSSQAGTQPVGSGDSQTTNQTLSAGVDKAFAYGTTLSAEVGIEDERLRQDPAMTADNQAGYATLVVSQPLMKDRGSAVNRHDIDNAAIAAAQSNLALKQAVIDTVAQTQTYYWQLYSAVESLAVYKQSLALARQFLSEVKAKIRIGSAAALDALEAEAEVAAREEAVITAQNTVDNSQDTLRNYIFGGIEKGIDLVCGEKPQITQMPIDEEALTRTALSSRLDYKISQLSLEATENDVTYYQNQKLPELTVSGTLAYTGNDVDGDPGLTASYADAYSGSLSLTLAFPWGLAKDQANYRSAALSRRQAEIALKATRSQIELEVRTAMRNLAAAYKRHQAARVSAELAQKKLDAEQVKFANGLSTSYNVLLYQRDLTGARDSLVNAMINYQVALIQLDKTLGTTLEQLQIEFKEVQG